MARDPAPPAATQDGRRGAALVLVKGAHTAIWFSIEACVAYVLAMGFLGRTDRRVAVAAGVVGAE